MTDEEKELIKLMKEWKAEIKDLTADTINAISELNSIKTEFKKPTKTEWFYKFLPYIVAVLFFIVGLYWITFVACGGTIKFGDNEMTIPCKNPSVEAN